MVETLVDSAVEKLMVAVKLNQATIQGPYTTFIYVTWSISLVRSVPAVMDPSGLVADNDDTRGPIVITPSRSQAGPALASGEYGERHCCGGWASSLYVENGDGSRKDASAEKASQVQEPGHYRSITKPRTV